MAHEKEVSEQAKNAGGVILLLAIVAGVLWLGGAFAFIHSYIGFDAFDDLQPAMQAGLAIFAVLPSFLIWFAGAAAREGARARAEGRRLAEAADRLLSPAPEAEAAARRLGVSVRGEIASLERAIDAALTKAREIEQLVAKQTLSMDSAVTAAAQGANQMVHGMEKERGALLQIAADLNSQATQIGDSISRQTRLIADAARSAESEIRVADEALDSRLSSFGAAAALISDRIGALSGAAKTSADSALKLESVLGGALDALTKATTLTDAARASAEAATYAATNTASAVRDATSKAVEDAKRAADIVRGEATAVEREAEAALHRLREAADAARVAAQSARGAAGATAADVARIAAEEPRPAPAPAPAQNSTYARREARQDDQRRDDTSDRRERAREREREPDREQGFGEAMAGIPPSRPSSVTPLRPQAAEKDGEAGRWTWREVLASIEQERQPAAPAGGARAATARAAAEPAARARHPLPAVDIIEAAGLRLGEVFNLSTLDRIAQRARNGTQARRRAVRDASPEAVRRLADYLDRDQESRSQANEFMRTEGVRIAELLGRGRASMSADATRAFLILDAASG